MKTGMVTIWNNIKDNNEDGAESITPSGAVNTALITLASGADNIGVYVPLLAGFTFGQMMFCTVIFFVMTGLFCILGKKLADMPVFRTIMEKYRQILTPVIYIILGLYIIFS